MIERVPSRARAPVHSTLALLSGLALALTPGAARAQETSRPDIVDPNGHPFRTPVVSPLESVLRIAPARIQRGDRERTVALATLGAILGFRIHESDNGRFELTGALYGNGASRFDLQGKQNQFIEITYRAGFHLRARLDAVAARLELYHVSSHLGDEYLLATGIEPVSSSREGIELLLQASPFAGLAVYGGPGWVFRSTLPYRSPSVRAGFDWEPTREGGVRPYLGIDAHAWSELDWDPTVAAEGGAAIGRHVRLGVMLGFGPSRADQFFRAHETLFGLSASFHR